MRLTNSWTSSALFNGSLRGSSGRHQRRRAALVVSSSSGSATAGGGDDGNNVNSCSIKFIQEIKEKMDDPLAESNATAMALVFLTVLAVVGYISSGLGSLNVANNIQVAIQLVVQAVAKTGFTAAFALIFISELGCLLYTSPSPRD